MFDILFGWRKASKCKKLVKAVQCRLKLLKSKKCCIVNQLKEDVAELLRHGLDQSAFERVEQLITDKRAVEVYELLDQFCEFIIINLPYIRRHKDCPNDINEAASTLIFSSARLGELPELLSIRKLFGERYGQRFVTTALELLPGNLVNHQIKEKAYTKSVPDDVKYRLLGEIASSCIQSGPYFLEYKPELQEDQATNGSNQISSGEVQVSNDDKAHGLQLSNGGETERKMLRVDSFSVNKSPKELPFGLGNDQSILNGVQDLDPGEVEKLTKPEYCGEMVRLTVAEESSSETSAQLPEETIYLDDIEEFVPPVTKGGDLQDQRLFVFKSFSVPLKEETDYGIKMNAAKEQDFTQEKSVSRRPRKVRKASRKRSRRSMSQEGRNVTDVECATYYGDSDDNSPDNKRKSHHQRQRRDKILVQKSQKSDGAKARDTFSLIKSREHNLELGRRSKSSEDIVAKCSLGHPCYFNSKNEKGAPRIESSTEKDFAMHSLKTGEFRFSKYYHTGNTENNGVGDEIQPTPVRAISMPAEWPKEDSVDIMRSISFPLEQPRGGYSTCRHIHPKLPDYDELAARFTALKRANLQHKQQQRDLKI